MPGRRGRTDVAVGGRAARSRLPRPHRTGPFGASPIGALDRDAAVAEVLTRLAARRSGWNAADIRGEVEQAIARANIVTTSAVRGELAEDLTARTLAGCVPLLERPGLPEHLRALTSPAVLEVEADLSARFAARADDANSLRRPDSARGAGRGRGSGLGRDPDRGGRAARRRPAAGGDRGCRGRGEDQHPGRGPRRPRAPGPPPDGGDADAAGGESRPGGAGISARRRRRGWSTSTATAGTTTAPGPASKPANSTPPPGTSTAARRRTRCCAAAICCSSTRPGCSIRTPPARYSPSPTKPTCGSRWSGIGTNSPPSAAAACSNSPTRWTPAEAQLSLDRVHRFTRVEAGPDGRAATMPDVEYAQLSLAMRTGDDPGAVFDTLLDRGQVRAARQRRRPHRGADRARRHRRRAHSRHRERGGNGGGRRYPRAGRRPQRRDPRPARRGPDGSTISTP